MMVFPKYLFIVINVSSNGGGVSKTQSRHVSQDPEPLICNLLQKLQDVLEPSAPYLQPVTETPPCFRTPSLSLHYRQQAPYRYYTGALFGNKIMKCYTL